MSQCMIDTIKELRQIAVAHNEAADVIERLLATKQEAAPPTGVEPAKPKPTPKKAEKLKYHTNDKDIKLALGTKTMSPFSIVKTLRVDFNTQVTEEFVTIRLKRGRDSSFKQEPEGFWRVIGA